ncbi:MAG: hypothetical protein IPM26_01340 [Saprospiraceae bacterium]|nr:hypothetical protein [Saprospiraceae bacterium]
MPFYANRIIIDNPESHLDSQDTDGIHGHYTLNQNISRHLTELIQD